MSAPGLTLRGFKSSVLISVEATGTTHRRGRQHERPLWADSGAQYTARRDGRYRRIWAVRRYRREGQLWVKLRPALLFSFGQHLNP